MKPLTVEVTLKDIEQAKPDEATNPVARALRRTTGRDWIVMFCAIAVEARPPHRIIKLPVSLHEQLKRFRQTRRMQPSYVRLAIQSQSQAF